MFSNGISFINVMLYGGAVKSLIIEVPCYISENTYVEEILSNLTIYELQNIIGAECVPIDYNLPFLQEPKLIPFEPSVGPICIHDKVYKLKKIKEHYIKRCNGQR